MPLPGARVDRAGREGLMAWSSPGRGSPLTFRCTKCRSTLSARYNSERRGYLDDVTIGRIRTRREVVGRLACSPRNAAWSVEYTCSCGHVGWSSHTDLVYAFQRANGVELPKIPPPCLPNKPFAVGELIQALEVAELMSRNVLAGGHVP